MAPKIYWTKGWSFKVIDELRTGSAWDSKVTPKLFINSILSIKVKGLVDSRPVVPDGAAAELKNRTLVGTPSTRWRSKVVMLVV